MNQYFPIIASAATVNTAGITYLYRHTIARWWAPSRRKARIAELERAVLTEQQKRLAVEQERDAIDAEAIACIARWSAALDYAHAQTAMWRDAFISGTEPGPVLAVPVAAEAIVEPEGARVVDLLAYREQMAATPVGDYESFTGGWNRDEVRAMVDAAHESPVPA